MKISQWNRNSSVRKSHSLVIIDENSDDEESVGNEDFQAYKENIFSDGIFEQAPDIEETQQDQNRFNPGLNLDNRDDLVIDHGELDFTLQNQPGMQAVAID